MIIAQQKSFEKFTKVFGYPLLFFNSTLYNKYVVKIKYKGDR